MPLNIVMGEWPWVFIRPGRIMASPAWIISSNSGSGLFWRSETSSILSPEIITLASRTGSSPSTIVKRVPPSIMMSNFFLLSTIFS